MLRSSYSSRAKGVDFFSRPLTQYVGHKGLRRSYNKVKMDNNAKKNPHSMFVVSLTTNRDGKRCIIIMKLHTKDVGHGSCHKE